VPVSLLDRLRWAIAPDQRRSASLMLGGIAVFMGYFRWFFRAEVDEQSRQ
jgi:hypothetical protein